MWADRYSKTTCASAPGASLADHPPAGDAVRDNGVMTSSATTDAVTSLRTRLADETDVAVAYLFGSRARGTARPDSDYDVAVLFSAPPDHRRTLELAADLGPRVDLVDLGEAPIPLAYRVVRDGILLVSRDDHARIDHRVRTIDRYLDMAPMRQTLATGLRHRIEEGRFGRP